jgi:hypothetical protein
MKYRKLRIAWSVAWGIACLLLIVLWVRSYSQWDNIRVKPNAGHYILCRSVVGQFSVGYLGENVIARPTFEWAIYDNPQVDKQGWVTASFTPGSNRLLSLELVHSELGFKVTANTFERQITTRHSFLAMLTALFASVVWLRWRFSLRTLLIAMTLVAVGMGWIVYVTR